LLYGEAQCEGYYHLLAIGFMTTFLALEAAWHFTACKIKGKTIKPLSV